VRLPNPDTVLRRWLWTALAVAICAHLYGLYTPGEPGLVECFPHADKVLHFLGFAIPSTLAVLLTRRWWPIAVFAANALISEVVQHFWLPYRDGGVGDALTDLAGLVPAVVLCWWLSRRRLQAASSASAESSPISSTSAASRRPEA
jgi:VanZ family protein